MSEPSPVVSATVRFAPFELDLRSGDLYKLGHRQSLPEQPFQILKMLVERPGELVTREELRERLWPGGHTFVDFDHGLNAAVKRLRDALGDSAGTPRFIETVPRRGYRFIASIDPPRVPASAAGGASGPRRSQRRLRLAIIGVALVLALATSVSVGWVLLARSRTGRSVQMPGVHPIVRLTTGQGFDTDPTWSPDGRYIAYASDRAGNFDIWVQPVAGGEAIQLTHSPDPETHPAWSPDGSDIIVFESARDGGRWLSAIPAHGGPERRLTTFGIRPRWAPDGSQVLFANEDYDMVPQLYAVRLDGSAPRPVIKSFLDHVDSVLAWNWYSDSQSVSLLAHYRPRGWGFYNVPLSGGPLLKLDTDKVLTFCQCPAWSVEQHLFDWAPGGRALFMECAHDLTMDVWRFGIDPERHAMVDATRMTTGTGQALPVAVSPDGTRVAFTSRNMRLRLWTFPFDALAGHVTGTGEPITDANGYTWESDLSANGRRLIYRLSRQGASLDELWTTNLETHQSQMLARDEQVRSSPQLSPDGARLAYNWERPIPNKAQSSEVALVVGDTDGTHAQPITVPRVVNSEADTGFIPTGWSPDGQAVLASTSKALARCPLRAARSEDRVKVLASSEDAGIWQARYSPDGRWISFVSNMLDGLGGISVAIMPAAGAPANQWIRVTDRRGWADKPRWSPDGTLLYFIKPKGQFWNLWAVRFDGQRGMLVGDPFQITHFETAARQLSPILRTAEIGVAPHALVLSIMEREGGVWMVDNADH